ncbi:MAG TPA: asparagine synthase-related protein [Tepidisphaeraceae bacterium]|jgi:hypothetical protein|nr:asparagine synthase-related protein [Tepidisphaeraceae bacterium]
MFAWQPQAAAGPFRNLFDGMRRVTLDTADAAAIGAEVVAGPKAQLAIWSDRPSGFSAYVWGRPTHPTHRGDALIRWCVKQVREGTLPRLTELVGTFVLLIDDRRERRVHCVGDAMGIAPWFQGRHAGRWVGGTNIWPIQRAGLAGKAVNYDAVGSWLYFGYNLTDGSLLQDYRRLTAGTVATFAGDTLTEETYARLTPGEARPPRGQIAHTIFEQISQAFDQSTDGLETVSLALSGGYDSRILAALAAKKNGMKTQAFLVRDTDHEAAIVSRIAQRVGLPLHVIPTDGSRWNIFDEPFHSLPDGLPITRQVTHVVAQQRPGVPLINGFLGDIVTRGTGTQTDCQVELKAGEELVHYLTARRRLPGLRFDLLEPGFESRVEARAREAMRVLSDRGRALGKPFLYTGFYARMRYYTSNNFLQHLDVAEPINPFYTWPLIAQRFANHYDCFTWETSELLFQHHAPCLADIPHSERGAIPPPVQSVPSRCTKQWAAAMLADLPRRGFLPLLSRKKALSRLTGALLGRRDVDDVVLFLQRLSLLESWLRQAEIPFDWRAI